MKLSWLLVIQTHHEIEPLVEVFQNFSRLALLIVIACEFHDLEGVLDHGSTLRVHLWVRQTCETLIKLINFFNLVHWLDVQDIEVILINNLKESLNLVALLHRIHLFSELVGQDILFHFFWLAFQTFLSFNPGNHQLWELIYIFREDLAKVVALAWLDESMQRVNQRSFKTDWKSTDDEPCYLMSPHELMAWGIFIWHSDERSHVLDDGSNLVALLQDIWLLIQHLKHFRHKLQRFHSALDVDIQWWIICLHRRI